MTYNAKVQTTSVKQPANEILGTKDKELYFLIIETDKGKTQINVGLKTYEKIKEITKIK